MGYVMAAEIRFAPDDLMQILIDANATRREKCFENWPEALDRNK